LDYLPAFGGLAHLFWGHLPFLIQALKALQAQARNGPIGKVCLITKQSEWSGPPWRDRFRTQCW